MGAFLRRHAGVIQSALYVIILLLLIVFFCAPVYEVACIFTGLVVCGSPFIPAGRKRGKKGGLFSAGESRYFWTSWRVLVLYL